MHIKIKKICFLLFLVGIFGCSSSNKVYIYIPANQQTSYYSDYLVHKINGYFLELNTKESIQFLKDAIDIQYKIIDIASTNIANGNSLNYRAKIVQFSEDGTYITIEKDNEVNIAYELTQIEYHKMLCKQFIEVLERIDRRYIYPKH